MGARVASATLTAAHITASTLTSRVAATVVIHTAVIIVHTITVVIHTAMIVVHAATVVVHTAVIVVHAATVGVHTAMVVAARSATLMTATVIVVATGSVSATNRRHVVPSTYSSTASMRTARSGMPYMWPVCWPHGIEIASSTILMIMTWQAIVEIGVAIVVSIDTEPPSVVGKHDRTIEIVVGHITRPLSSREQTTESEIAMVENVVVLSIAVTKSHVIEVLVHTVDVIIVDHINQVDDVSPQTQGEGHAVGEETGVVAHHYVRHGLCVHHICHCQHHYCYKHCSNLSHSRYGFVESGA